MMHPAPRTIYNNDVDFAALALEDADFNKHLKSNAQLDFSNPEAVKQLTKSLLKRDFGIGIELPDDRLCPPVPNRFNYILWVQDLLDTTSDDYRDGYDEEREVVGLDIGTGSSCIYPLLGCAQRPQWRFLATDIDDKNISYARQNILRNNLAPRIRPLHTKPEDPLIPLDELGIDSITFTLTNPPFYPSASSLLSSATLKNRPPHSACTGAPVEMVHAPGGEVGFVTRIIAESAVLKTRVQWYTTMLGKLGSVGEVVEALRREGVGNWAVKEFVQGTGGKTRRWGVGWSWGNRRPREDASRGVSGMSGVPKQLLPFPAHFAFTIPQMPLTAVAERLNATLQALDLLRWRFKPSMSAGVGFAGGNVWSRAARRQREQRSAEEEGDKEVRGEGDESEEEEEEPALGFKVQLLMAKEGKEEGTDVHVRWLLGRESVLWESFCGMLKRQLVGG